jgi:hypothetical protein
MACCGSLCGMTPKISQQIERKLKEIFVVDPSINSLVLLSKDGHLISQTENPNQSISYELWAPLASLKRTADEFSRSINQLVNQQESPVFRIKGTKVIFTAYDIEHHMLALYQQVKADDENSDWIDENMNSDVDRQMTVIVDELKILTRGLQHQKR